jgi:hypothetical protein
MYRRLARRSALVLLVGLVIASLAVEAAAQTPPLSQTATDPRGRFTMAFPADWEVNTTANGATALVGTGPANGGVRPTINVVVDALGGPSSLEAYAAGAGRAAAAALPHYKMIQEAGTTLLGQPAYYRYSTWQTTGGVQLYQLQVFVVEGFNAFVITASTINQRDRILRDMALATRIITTFRVVSLTD